MVKVLFSKSPRLSRGAIGQLIRILMTKNVSDFAENAVSAAMYEPIILLPCSGIKRRRTSPDNRCPRRSGAVDCGAKKRARRSGLVSFKQVQVWASFCRSTLVRTHSRAPG